MTGRVKGPATGEILTAQFNGPEAKNLTNEEVITSLVLLSIVGNEFCDGEYLGATVLCATQNTKRPSVRSKMPSVTNSAQAASFRLRVSEPTEPGPPEKEKPAGDTLSTAKKEESETNFTTFLVADEVYWHNLKTIDVISEETRLRELNEHENSSSEIDFGSSKLEPLFSDHKDNPYKRAIVAQSEEEIRLKKAALELGNAFLERNLEQFLLPFNLNSEQFASLYQSTEKAIEQAQIVNETELIRLQGDYDLTLEQIIRLNAAIQREQSPIDKKIAFINQLAVETNKHFEIVRWRDWINRDKFFVDHQQKIMDCYSEVESLEKTITETATNFARRHAGNGGTAEQWLYRSHGYLTEESPAVIWLAAKLNFNRIIYPGEMLSCFKATRELFIVDKTSDTKSAKTAKIPDSHFQIHVENPKLLVNWLQPNFKKQWSKAQREAITARKTADNDEEDKATEIITSPNTHSFFSTQNSVKRKISEMQGGKLAVPNEQIKTIEKTDNEPRDGLNRLKAAMDLLSSLNKEDQKKVLSGSNLPISVLQEVILLKLEEAEQEGSLSNKNLPLNH